ncbi:MAG: hypothetical protein ACTHMM_11805 [Agriterribacter sp.]
MKTTILLITFGLVSATTFAQQSTVNATGSGSSSSEVKTDKTNGKIGVTGTAGAMANSEAAGKTAEGAVKAADKTKAAAEAKIKEAGNEAKNTVKNTNASASIQATSSVNGSANAGDNGNNALAVKSNNDVMLKKEIKGADVVKAVEKVENTAAAGVEKTSGKIKAGSAQVKSAVKSNAGKISGKTVSTVATVKTALQAKPVKAAVHTKTITGVKIR